MAIKTKSTKPKAGGKLLKKAVGAGVAALTGGKGSGTKRRSKGVNYWANKVLIQKLKTKYHRLRYGRV